MKNIGQRLGKLESAMQTQRPAWAFIIDGGEIFTPDVFPIRYLQQCGPIAPDGRKIVRCIHDDFNDGQAVLRAIFSTADDWIARGKAPWET